MIEKGPQPEYHQKTFEAWDEKAEEGWGEDGKPSEFFNEFLDKYKGELGEDVLDVGAGKGRYAIHLAEQGFNATALEPSEKMMKSAKEVAKEKDLDDKVNLIRGQSKDLPFDPESFDFVVSVGAIHHNKWPDIDKSFAEVGRVLKKEGHFFFQGRSINDTDREREQIADEQGYTATDKGGNKEGVVQHYFTREELEELAEENGFEIIGDPVETTTPSKRGEEYQKSRWEVVLKKIENK